MTLLRGLFLLAVAFGAGIVWLAPHPPMIDLPQHAGQLSLLRQLLAGGSQWAPLLQINPVTPYLIGFGLALPLTTFMPVAAAMKVLLTAAYLAFVAVCVALRRHLGADARLDWLFLTSFFGFAFQWGFFTYLTAAPLGLLLVLLAARQAQAPSRRQGVAMALLGTVLLVSHGLVFLFAMLTAGLLLLGPGPGLKARLQALWPLVLPGLLLGVYFVLRGRAEAAFAVAPTVPSVMWHLGIRHEVFTWAQGMQPAPVYFFASAVMAAAPWLLGLRIQFRRPATWLPFAAVATVLSLAPSFVFETSFVYERFALFLFPAYAWMFSAPQPATPRAALWGRATAALLATATISVLAVNGSRVWQFGRESADFDAVTADLQDGQRALALIYARRSEAAVNPGAYVHYGSWYQVEHQGLVDFNFAWVQPQIVRYRADQRPPVALAFPWRPQTFSWLRHGGQSYRYFLVRHDGKVPAGLFADAPCKPTLIKAQGHWQVYERAVCAP